MGRFRLLLVVCLSWLGVAGLPGDAAAWGKFGHLTVCDLAYRNFTDRTRAELKKLFQVARGGIFVKASGNTRGRRYTSFNIGCLEEDEFPRKHPDDHFINVARDVTEISNSCPGVASCILAGIGRDIAILKDASRSNQDRVFALMAVGHWIGDIHQPLHVSFADDRGGNRIEAKLQGRCGSGAYRVKELHGVWDNCLLEAGLFERVRKRADFKKSWGENTITYRAVDTLQANTTLTEEKAIVAGSPWQWADESYRITVQPEVLYCVIVEDACQYSSTMHSLPEGGKKRIQPIDQAYLAKFERVAQERVRKAGFRLAHLVNSALDPNYTEPEQGSTQKP